MLGPARGRGFGVTCVVIACRLQDLHPLDPVPLQDPLGDRLTAVDPAEDRELVVEQRIVHQVDEPLAVAGVAAAGRDAERAARVGAHQQLVPHERRVADVLVGVGPAALDHEVGLDPLELPSIVEPFPDQPQRPAPPWPASRRERAAR